MLVENSLLAGSKSTILIGCTVGVVSSAAQSVGLTLQRKSHLLEDILPSPYSRRPPYRRSRWRWGLLLFLLANVVGSSIQITTLPLVILSPLQAVGLVFNSICSAIMLDEPFTRYSLVGTLFISLGAFLIANYGAIPEPSHNLQELLTLLRRRPFLIWIALTGFVVINLLILIRMLKCQERAERRGDKVDSYFRCPRPKVLRGLLYGGVSGILSAHSLLMAKSAVELLIKAFTSTYADFLHWQTWAIVGLFLFLAVAQLYFLNCGLRICSTSVLYPLVFCIYNITTIINGLIYFEQVSKLSHVQFGLIVLGTFFVLLGVIALSWRLDNFSDFDNARIELDLDSDSDSVSLSLSLPIKDDGSNVGSRFYVAHEDDYLISSPLPQQSPPQLLTSSSGVDEYVSFGTPASGSTSWLPKLHGTHENQLLAQVQKTIKRPRQLSEEQSRILHELSGESEGHRPTHHHHHHQHHRPETYPLLGDRV